MADLPPTRSTSGFNVPVNDSVYMMRSITVNKTDKKKKSHK